jgi:hypothetical protein
LLSQWGKANVGFVSEDMETIGIETCFRIGRKPMSKLNFRIVRILKIELLSLWMRANVGIVFRGRGKMMDLICFQNG